MSPARGPSCSICGYEVAYSLPEFLAWYQHYRILYSHPGGVSITGVGVRLLFSDDHWVAPHGYNTSRWDEDAEPYNIGVLGEPPIDGRHGVLVHEACWSLLERAYHPTPVPMETLLAVCRSLPSSNCIFHYVWGHDFASLYYDDTALDPWELKFSHVSRDFSISEIAASDPCSIPEISELPFKEPATLLPSYIERPAPSEQMVDHFALLPSELTLQIALHLSTADALNARLASRSFLSIFYSRQFWASRFRAGAERSWLFESKGWDKSCNWQWLYHLTNKSHSTPEMHNRERLSMLIQDIQDVLCRRPQLASSLAIGGSGSQWIEASGDLREEQGFKAGCQIHHTQYASIPRGMSRITFSFIQVGGTKYIAGIKIIALQSIVAGLGYATDDELSLELSCLKELELAIGLGGIQAVRCKSDNGQTSQWCGNLRSAYRTRRLVHLSTITAIKAGFDGCKMVSLAVTSSGMPATQGDSLREAALWYPQIPGIDMDLNEDHFPTKRICTTRFLPIHCTMFNGPRGARLQNLTGTSALPYATPPSICFHYSENSSPDKGCQPGPDVIGGRHRIGGSLSPESKTSVFHIDGPGGEAIDSITTSSKHFSGDQVPWFFQGGVLVSIKFKTNRGRESYYLLSGQMYLSTPHDGFEVVERSFQAAPGHAICGFYWTHYEDYLLSIQAITEKLDEQATQ